MRYILLLGGTGAMGKHLVSLLDLNPDTQVYVTSRSHHKNTSNVTYIQGNALDDDFIVTVLRQRPWTAIFDFMIYTTEQFRKKVDIFLEATTQYVFISSSRVYDSSKTALTEDSKRLLDASKDMKYLNTDEYALTKARQENILKASRKTNWTIVRPYITFSETRLQLGVLEKENWLYRAIHGRTIVLSKDVLEKRTTLTYGYDIARSMVALIGHAKAYGETFHITVNESHTWEEILNVYTDVLEQYLGKRPKVLILDNFPYQHRNRPFYQLIYDRHFDRTFDNSKINALIDTKTFTPTLDGLRKCLELFLVQQNFRRIDWRGEAGRDRLTNEHPDYKEFPDKKTMIKYFIQRYFMPNSYF